jgi:hypothetical protein
MDTTASYLNGLTSPFTPIATPLTLVPHPGHENIPPHMVSPHTPLPMNFLPFSPFQSFLSTPSLHYAPSPLSPYPLSMMMTSQLSPAHFYAGCYPPSFLSLNDSQSEPNPSGQFLASMPPGYGTILC